LYNEKDLKNDQDSLPSSHESIQGNHGFSVELSSKKYINRVSLFTTRKEEVLVEGTIGSMEVLDILEGAVLHVKGSQGTIMIDLCEEKLKDLLNKERKKTSQKGD
jgi:hypothetical protein